MNTVTLYRQCLPVVAKLIESEDCSDLYGKSCYTNLPRDVVQDLLFYLTPNKLFSSQKILTEHGINTERVWHIHFKKRWSYKHQVVPRIFKHINEERDEQSSFDRYVEKHFHDVFRATSFPMSSQEGLLNKGLSQMLTSVHDHVVEKTKKDISTKEREKLVDQMKLIPYVSHLSILGNQSKTLFREYYLICFRKNVTRVDLHVLKKNCLLDATKLILDLLHNGKLKEVNLFNPRLAVRSLQRFIHACAGHIKPNVFSSESAPSDHKENQTVDSGNKDSEEEKPEEACGTDNWNTDATLNTFPIDMFMSMFKDKDKADILHEYLQADEEDEWLDTEDEISSDESSADELFDCALEGLDDENPDHDFDMQGLSWYKSKEIYSCVNPWEIEGVEEDKSPLDCVCTKKEFEVNFENGLEAFSLIGGETIESDFYNDAPKLAEVLLDVLPVWPKLKCLALAGCRIKDLFLPGEIASLTHRGLKEVIIENMKFNDGSILEFVGDILGQESREKPMERLRLMHIHTDIVAMQEDIDALPDTLNGFVEFELRGGNIFQKKGISYLSTLISRDQSLRHLSLCGLNSQKSSMMEFLEAIRVIGLLESLDLSENYIDAEVEDELCVTINSLPNLKSLYLKSILMSPGFLTGGAFTEVLINHKSLADLDLSDNRFGSVVQTFLRKILVEKSTKLQSINIGYNMCTGNMLLSSAKEVIDSQMSGTGSVRCCLRKLDISGNKLGKLAKEVVKSWGLVVLNVECKCEDFTVPFAEHMSLM